MLVGLQLVNEQQIRRAGPGRPRLEELIQARRLRYSRVDPSEHWQTYEELVQGVAVSGVHFADCEDLACALAAEIRSDPAHPMHDPQAAPYVYKTGPNLSHVVVRARGQLLDPSEWAGMGWDEPEAIGRHQAQQSLLARWALGAAYPEPWGGC